MDTQVPGCQVVNTCILLAFLLIVSHEHCDAATIVDVIGSAALMTLVAGHHVSLSITTNYLRPAPVGSIVRIEAMVSNGKMCKMRCSPPEYAGVRVFIRVCLFPIASAGPQAWCQCQHD